MDTEIENEIIGRLWLWTQSISKTQELLKTAFRANVGKQQDIQLAEQETYLKNLNDFAKQQPDYKSEIIYNTHKQKFDEIYSRDFPTWLECCAVHDACIELAIVYFCQIFNLGLKQTREAAKNDKTFRNEHLSIILSKVFPTDDEMCKFKLFQESIVDVRNKTIGHIDADAYSIQHGKPISKLTGPNILWRDLDLEFWYSFLEKMNITIHNYINELKLKYHTNSVA